MKHFENQDTDSVLLSVGNEYDCDNPTLTYRKRTLVKIQVSNPNVNNYFLMLNKWTMLPSGP